MYVATRPLLGSSFIYCDCIKLCGRASDHIRFHIPPPIYFLFSFYRCLAYWVCGRRYLKTISEKNEHPFQGIDEAEKARSEKCSVHLLQVFTLEVFQAVSPVLKDLY